MNIQKPNLLVSSYKLHILIKEKSPHCLIKKYISQVHNILHCFQKIFDDPKWISDLNYLEKELLYISVKEFKNIKLYIPEYITKWIYSLIIASKYLKSSKYIYLASQFMITLINNVEYVNINDLHKLDIFITISILLINLKHLEQKHTPIIKLYIKLLTFILENNIPRIIEYIHNTKPLDTNDPYELGFLLECCLKIRLIIQYNIIDNKLLYKLYEQLLKQSRLSLNNIQFKTHRINNDAYRWYNLCIGLESIKILNNYYINNKFIDKYYNNVKIIYKYYVLKRNIINNFNTYSYNKGNWNKYNDINMIMLKNTDFPILSI